MSSDELDRLTSSFQTYNADEDHGLWLCVDMEYPDSLHDDHNDFPLAPESRKVFWNELSRRQQILFALQWDKAPDDPCLRTKFEAQPAKLLATLYDKKSYCLHIKVSFVCNYDTNLTLDIFSMFCIMLIIHKI